MSAPSLEGFYYIFKVPTGWELRPYRYGDDWTYRSESLEAVIGYLSRFAGYGGGFEISVIVDLEICGWL